MTRVVVIAPLKAGKRDEARRLLELGPPYDLAGTTLTGHHVYRTDAEAVFIFEGEKPMPAVEHLIGDAGVVKTAAAWTACLDGRPRIALEAFSWIRATNG